MIQGNFGRRHISAVIARSISAMTHRAAAAAPPLYHTIPQFWSNSILLTIFENSPIGDRGAKNPPLKFTLFYYSSFYTILNQFFYYFWKFDSIGGKWPRGPKIFFQNCLSYSLLLKKLNLLALSKIIQQKCIKYNW